MTVHSIGNGRVCIYGRGGDIFQAFGPDYSSPEAFTLHTEQVFTPKRVSHSEYQYSSDSASLYDYMPEKLPVFCRMVDGEVCFTLDVKCTESVFRVPDSDIYMTVTHEGAVVYPYEYVNGSPHGYVCAKKRFFGFICRGGEVEKLTGTSLRINMKNGTLIFAFADTPGELFSLLAGDYTPSHKRVYSPPLGGKAATDVYDTVAAQQSVTGAVLAGYNYHLCYIRDNYGVFRALLALGDTERAKSLLYYYFDIYTTYGRIHNAQSPAGYAFHVHENDEVEITGYLLLMIFFYYEHTGDDNVFKDSYPLLSYCLNAQHNNMNCGMLPFNGDETYIAGGLLPRCAINDGSLECTAIYHLSLCLAMKHQRFLPLFGRERDFVRGDRELIEKTFTDNFSENGTLYCNKPDIGYAPSYREGVRACGHGFGLSFANANGDYVCPDCVGRNLPPFYTDYGKRFEIPSAILSPAFIGSPLLPRDVIKRAAQTVLQGMESRQKLVGYEYGYLLYILGDIGGIKEKMLAQRDALGSWSEYYIDGEQSGTLCRTWESSVNIVALLKQSVDE